MMPLDRLIRQQQQQTLRAAYRTVTACVPTLTDTGNYDPTSESPVDITTGDPAGRSASWTVQQFHARIGGPTYTELHIAEFGYETGDVKLFIGPRDLAVVQAVFANPEAYFFLDGTRYRPFGSINATGVFHTDERVVSCHKHEPRITASGY